MVQTLNILIVDDDKHAIETLTDLLEIHEFNVSSAPDGLSAMAVAQKSKPDVILLDIRMPGLDGYTVCETLRKTIGQEVHIILFTAYATLVDVTRGKQAGANDFISKMDDFSNLLRILKELKK